MVTAITPTPTGEGKTAISIGLTRALERRAREGKHLRVASVASFFVSRVDTEVDSRLAWLRAQTEDTNSQAPRQPFLVFW
ncbi:MAG: formate--tetrahydrofolate ligase [Truepera sp.]|nr:formate--tetrahydrofolate ligase [Truepera sp.]